MAPCQSLATFVRSILRMRSIASVSASLFVRTLISTRFGFVVVFGFVYSRATMPKNSFFLFHSPFTKLVRKSFARLYQDDWIAGRKIDMPTSGINAEWQRKSLPETYNLNDMHKAFMDATTPYYNSKVVPSLLLSKQLGNSYTGSLYASLASLVSEVDPEKLKDSRAVLFSYGSGLASTMFSVRFDASTHAIRDNLSIHKRLGQRRSVSAEEFTKTLALRERTHSLASYIPTQPLDDLFPGTYYLAEVDSLKRRKYALKQ